ncbi:hypothetical protein M0R88_03465 [Halorussus gelatinilyticus]|uniref:Uncharacterized protein n=1 Tax=Halorussus gelatinilyticus TaxID=2937524 RepID=A0A8U0IK85_9EURY|nr:hypothetical protein [Halorussus gelatinilyticus]UPW01168.1 hypothetical protein M0R88_03465 [Halorussus gelatinilyticus]
MVLLPETGTMGDKIVEERSSEYVLKMRGGGRADNPPNNKITEWGPFYRNEVFGEVRIWLEANSRGYPELFAPIADWDRQNFQWLVMEKAKLPEDPIPAIEILKRKFNQRDDWTIDDAEVGVLDDRYVFIDYGEFWLRDSWNVSEENLLGRG